MNETTLLGIDIGGTKIAGGIVDAATGKVLRAERVPTLASAGGAAVLNRAVTLAKTLLAGASAAGLPAPAAVGIGAGGQIDPDSGIVLSATDVLPGWAGTRLREAFEDATRLPAAVDNDVNALAVGETRFGAGRDCANVVYLALGTGVGGAILIGGRLYHSRTGVSGELGHLILDPNGYHCTCGGKGCLEQYASGPALWRRFHELGGAIPENSDVTLTDLADADVSGPAARTLADVGHYLGIGLASLANIFGPDRFIIGGGLADLGDRLLSPARRTLAERALPPVRKTPVVPAALGTDAAIIGAASLVADRV